MSRLMSVVNTFVGNLRKTRIASYANFVQKDFLYEDHSHSGTMLVRFAKQIALENSQNGKIVKNSIKYSQFYPVHNQDKYQSELRNVPSDQLPRLVMFTANYRSNADVAKFFRVVNSLDNEAERRIKDLDYRDTQELMLMFMYLLPNKVTELDFVRTGLEKLLLDFEQHESKENFLQICFYLGLFKKSPQYREHLKSFLYTHLPKYLNDLSSLQFALVVNSAFKCSLPMTDEEFKQRLIGEVLNTNDNVDLQLLVTFAKSLRQNKVRSQEVLDRVEQLLERGQICDMDLRGYAHLLTLFAESRRIPEKLGQEVVRICMQIIQLEHEKSLNLSRNEPYTNPNFRPKDLATFLWCCTSLPDGSLSQDDLNLLVTVILWKLRNYEYKYEYDKFVDTLQSLVFLGARSDVLFKSFYNDKNFLIPPKNRNRIKLDSRQMLLTTCLEIELPELVPENLKNKNIANPVDVPGYLLEKRPIFSEIQGILQGLKDDLGLVKVECKIPIQNINIPSYHIEAETSQGENRSIWIEILDKHTTMADLVNPTPIVRLKWRLMMTLGHKIVPIFIEGLEGQSLVDCIRSSIKDYLDAADTESVEKRATEN